MTTTERPNMPPIECAPWCRDGDGHPNDFCEEDQTCFSSGEYVALSLEEPHEGYTPDEAPQLIGVMARRDHLMATVYVHLQDIRLHGPSYPYNVLDHAVHLTPDEALHLAQALISTAESVRSTPMCRTPRG